MLRPGRDAYPAMNLRLKINEYSSHEEEEYNRKTNANEVEGSKKGISGKLSNIRLAPCNLRVIQTISKCAWVEVTISTLTSKNLVN